MRRRVQHEEMLPLLTRHEVQVLRRAGHSREDVARRTGVSVRTIQRIDDEAVVSHVDDRAAARARRIGRPPKAAAWRAFVARLLAETPALPTLELLRRARLDGYAGSKSPFYALVAALRPPPAQPLVRFEGVAGEFSQHDFGQVDVRFVDGRRARVHFFASRLKYSRWVAVTLVPDERVESLVRPLVDHFSAFGGVPLLAVFDRPRTVVAKGGVGRAVVEWNPTFAQVMLELGVGVEICAPRGGNQMGAVERLVGWVKNSFFKPRRFVDRADLEQQLAAWLRDANERVVCRATGVTPAARIADERARLRPLRVAPADLARRIPVVVGPTATVLHEGATYSMPARATGLPATLYLFRDRVRLVAGRFEADHQRLAPGQHSVLSAHRAQLLAEVHGTRGKRYYQRQQLLALGAEAVAYLTELVHRRPNAWIGDVEQLFALLQTHGEAAVRDALGRATAAEVYGAEYVRHLLPTSEVAS